MKKFIVFSAILLVAFTFSISDLISEPIESNAIYQGYKKIVDKFGDIKYHKQT
jgi:hypothetical protein